MKILILSLLFLISCGKKVIAIKGDTGEDGADGISLLVKYSTFSNSTTCTKGGIITSFYRDMNSDGEVTPEIDILQTTYITCNGADGEDGKDKEDKKEKKDKKERH